MDNSYFQKPGETTQWYGPGYGRRRYVSPGFGIDPRFYGRRRRRRTIGIGPGFVIGPGFGVAPGFFIGPGFGRRGYGRRGWW